mgnify:CR=1 FL=1
MATKKRKTSRTRKIKSVVAYKKVRNISESVYSLLNLLNPKIKPKTVLIKPNLVIGAPPGKGITTNVYVVKSVVEWLREKGKRIVIAEGSGGMPTMEAFKKSGYFAIKDVEFVDLNNDSYVKVKIKDALEWNEISVAKTFYKAKYVINMPVAKCHHITGVSLGIKNLMGVLQPLGKMHEHGTKSHIHHEWSYGLMPRKKAKELFERRLIDLLRVKKVDLTIIDGTYSLQQWETSPFPVRTMFALASTDIIAADIVCTQIMGISPEKIYHLQLAQAVLGKRKIEIIGDKPKQFSIKPSEEWIELIE